MAAAAAAAAAAGAEAKATVSVTVLFFAKSRELVGQSEAKVDLPGHALSADELLELLCARFGGLRAIADSLGLAVNEEYVADGDPVTLNSGDELAIIPPISGG